MQSVLTSISRPVNILACSYHIGSCKKIILKKEQELKRPGFFNLKTKFMTPSQGLCGLYVFTGI